MKKYEPIKKSQLEINYGIETVYTLIICAIGVNLTACGIALLFSRDVDISCIWCDDDSNIGDFIFPFGLCSLY